MQLNNANKNYFNWDDLLFQHVTEWMKMDANRISTDQGSPSADDMQALDILDSSIYCLPSGHYEIGHYQ